MNNNYFYIQFMKFRAGERGGENRSTTYLWRSRKETDNTPIQLKDRFIKLSRHRKFVPIPESDLDLLPPETRSRYLVSQLTG